jgi:hypothetical protein
MYAQSKLESEIILKYLGAKNQRVYTGLPKSAKVTYSFKERKTLVLIIITVCRIL